MTHDGIIATIDLQAIADNYRSIQQVAPTAQITAVVKADAYGLGMETVAKALHASGCRTFYTALYAEAVKLRAALPDAVIAPFHGIAAGAEKEAQALNLAPVINNIPALERMRNFARALGKPVRVVLHVDTGMHRLGFSQGEWQKLQSEPAQMEGLDVGMVMSHMACSDEPGHPMNEMQRARFAELAGAFPKAKKSFANSHGIYLGAGYHFDQCRPGRALSGTNMRSSKTPLKLAVGLSAPILQVRSVDSDGTVGYGASYPVTKGARLATLAGGYADGLMRSLSPSAQHRTHFYLHGHKVPLMGRVSMDLIVVDVSAVPENLVYPGAKVEIAGPHQSMDDLADQANTIGYEMLTHIAARVQRNYLPLKVSHEQQSSLSRA